MDTPGNYIPVGLWQVTRQPKPKAIFIRTHLPFQHWHLEKHSPTHRAQSLGPNHSWHILTFKAKDVWDLRQRGRLQIHPRESKEEGKSTERYVAEPVSQENVFIYTVRVNFIKCRSTHAIPQHSSITNHLVWHTGTCPILFLAACTLYPSGIEPTVVSEHIMLFHNPNSTPLQPMYWVLELFARKWRSCLHLSILNNLRLGTYQITIIFVE